MRHSPPPPPSRQAVEYAEAVHKKTAILRLGSQLKVSWRCTFHCGSSFTVSLFYGVAVLLRRGCCFMCVCFAWLCLSPVRPSVGAHGARASESLESLEYLLLATILRTTYYYTMPTAILFYPLLTKVNMVQHREIEGARKLQRQV